MDRLSRLRINFEKQEIKGDQTILNKEEWFKVNGWGYKDTEFLLAEDGNISITGDRYQFSGQKMPKFKEWCETVVGLDALVVHFPQTDIPVDPPVLNEGFEKAVQNKIDELTTSKLARINHSHGHTLRQIYTLRYGKFDRIVDYVAYITSHEQAQLLIQAAKQHNVVLIPMGGGTNVTEALMCDGGEKRTIVSVDMTRMNKLLWGDKKNLVCCVQAGIVGRDLEKQLFKYGVCCGHEPDSVEFSTLGGWVSTRASGMKKNRYGNIEDIVVGIKIATPIGTFQKNQHSPRMSSGPDINEFILGHEGNFGIITECIIKLRRLPEVRVYDSLIFHSFEEGIDFMYEVAQTKMWPASLRLVDNLQFQFGMALKTEEKDKWKEYVHKAKVYFATKVLRFDINKMCLCTVLFEGSKQQVANQQSSLYSIANKYHGFRAGSENGERGYFLTFVIGYLRDFGLNYELVAESFETSLPWKDVSKMCTAVSKRIHDDCKRHGVEKEPFVSFRVTQVYDTGAAVYVYFGFIHHGMADPVAVYSDIEDGARDQIMKYGGSISHHHGVGKLRKKFLPRSIGDTGLEMLRGLKKTIDPTNIFATGNLI